MRSHQKQCVYQVLAVEAYNWARSHQKIVFVFMMLESNLNVARSQPKNIIERIISLIVYVVDPPRRRGKHPVMSPALEKALSEIEKEAEERLEVLRSRKKQVEEGEKRLSRRSLRSNRKVTDLLQRRKSVAV